MELRLCLVMSPEDAEGAVRIADDPHVSADVHRMGVGESPSVRADLVLCWLRIFVFWLGVWQDREKSKALIVESVKRKQGVIKRRSRERKRRKRK